MNKTRYYAYTHAPIPFGFRQTVERFSVEEVPLYKFDGKGNYLILKLKKREMSTHKLLSVLKQATGVTEREIGYAGLKDKSATTIQYISLPKSAQKALVKNLTTERVEILERTLHHTPVKIGHLKGNRFSIVLHHIASKDAERFQAVAKRMEREGFPNYYGYQRFGEDGRSYVQGREIAHSGKRLKGSREKLLVAAYQSHLFNRWLASRVKLSRIVTDEKSAKAAKILEYPEKLVEALAVQPQLFKLFLGDLMSGYPYGRHRFVKEMISSASSFAKREITPTGLLCGERVARAQSDAGYLEAPFDDSELMSLRGDRRPAWIWPEEVTMQYDAPLQQMRISFFLPKGAYATTFLEEIGKYPLLPAKT